MPPRKKMGTGRVSFEKMRSAFFFATLIILIVAMFYIFRPFFYPLFWAAVIAVLFYPFYGRMVRLLKSKTLSSFISILVILLVIFLPLTLVGTLLYYESQDVYQSASQFVISQNSDIVSSRFAGTFVEPYIDSIKTQWTATISNAAKTFSGFILSSFSSVLESIRVILRFIFMFLLMLYALFYFFKDGRHILERLMRISPLGDKYETMLYHRFTSTARATLKSTLIIGGIQGILGGIFFWLAGIEGAFIWAIVMIIFAIIPAIGPALALVPAGIIMLVFGNIWQAGLLLLGALFVSVIDNLLRGPLIGKDIQMHPLIVLLATLGGLVMFGVSGFVIGPVIAALFISVISIYSHYYKNELKNN